jgi:cell division septal protein FtsQ
LESFPAFYCIESDPDRTICRAFAKRQYFYLGISRMEIRTNRTPEGPDVKNSPPPDKARQLRKKNVQKLGKGPIPVRRFMPLIKSIGKLSSLLLMAVFMLLIFVYAYTSEKFSLRNVTFFGCKELDQKQLEQIVRQNFPTNILRIDLHRLKNRIEKETWARNAEIRRVLPSDLLIYIQERTPRLILEMQGELMIADADGILLDKYSPRYGKLDAPVIKGILGENAESYRQYQEENTARIRQALDMLSEIESGSPLYTRNISEIDVSDKKNLKIMLVDDTADIYLGNKDYLKRFKNLMDKLSDYQKLKGEYDDIPIVDLRFDDKIIYKPRRTGPEPIGRTTN